MTDDRVVVDVVDDAGRARVLARGEHAEARQQHEHARQAGTRRGGPRRRLTRALASTYARVVVDEAGDRAARRRRPPPAIAGSVSGTKQGTRFV